MRRRGVLQGTVASLTIGSIAGVASARRERTEVESQSGNGAKFTTLGVNTFDADDDGNVDLSFVPAKGRVGGRAGVRNLTSNGVSQGDYLTSVQPISPTSIGAFTGDDPTTLEYDYYDTGDNEAATPDEVWVQVDDEGESRSFYRTSNDNDEGGAVGEWLTRAIHDEIVGDPQYNAGFKWFEIVDGDVAGGNESLVELVGEDATLERVGVGGSRFGGSVVTDFYIDNLRLGGDPVGNFPAQGRGNGN